MASDIHPVPLVTDGSGQATDRIAGSDQNGFGPLRSYSSIAAVRPSGPAPTMIAVCCFMVLLRLLA
jgi:hypothetical protein